MKSAIQETVTLPKYRWLQAARYQPQKFMKPCGRDRNYIFLRTNTNAPGCQKVETRTTSACVRDCIHNGLQCITRGIHGLASSQGERALLYSNVEALGYGC
ncbi:hypothetical protein MTO96_011188 [Rhipicephalus appendiculatus]